MGIEKEKADMMNLVKQHSTKLQQTAAARGILDNDSDTENAQTTKKGRGRKRKSTPAEKATEDTQAESEDGMVENDETTTNFKTSKSSSKSSKKKKKQQPLENNSDEEIQPTPPN